MKIAFTGATGFIGRHAVRKALELGIPVRALYRQSSDRSGMESLAIEWIAGDIRDVRSWRDLLSGCDALIHLGAAGVANLNDAHDALRTNLPSFSYLLEEASTRGPIRVVLAGSCYEYGRTGERIGMRGLREDDNLDPVNAYAAAKAAASLIVRHLSRELGLETFILRPFQTYGEGESSNRLIPALIDAAVRRKIIKTTDGSQIRDFVHVDDVADGFIKAATCIWPGDRIQKEVCFLNLGTGTATSVADVIRLIARLSGCEEHLIQLGEIPHREPEMWRLVSDPSAARTQIKWASKITLDSAIKQLIEHKRDLIGL